MYDLSTRVRNCLDKKKPAKVETVTQTVTIGTDEEEDYQRAIAEFKEAWRPIARIMKCILYIGLTFTVLWAMANTGVVNDCYLDKECREWVKWNR
jgi:hypothetical protein